MKYNFVALLKKTPTQVLPCEICHIFKNTYLEEHARMTVSNCTAP